MYEHCDATPCYVHLSNFIIGLSFILGSKPDQEKAGSVSAIIILEIQYYVVVDTGYNRKQVAEVINTF